MDDKNKDRIVRSFGKQGFLRFLGAQLLSVEEGLVEITCPFSEDKTQQNGYFHAGVTTTIADVACGYAALTTMPLDAAVLTVEFKVNFLRPASGSAIRAIGKVLKAGKKLTVCSAFVYDDTGKEVASMQATMICLTSTRI